MEDLEIIELYHSRNQDAISETATKYGGLLYTVAKNIIHSHEDSEEIVSDSYGSAWEAMPPQRPNSLTAFLCRITRNLSIDRYRKNHAQKREGILLELSELEGESVHMEDRLELGELTKSIEKFLSTLPKDDRVLFMRRYFFHESVQDLAKEAKCKENNISGRLYRLRLKLKSRLAEEGYAL